MWGSAQFSGALSRSAHAYLGPVGVVLILMGFVAVQASVRLARRLERRVAQLRRALLGGHAELDERCAASTWTVGFPTLVGVVWIVQVGLYVAQENLEAHAVAMRAPGLGAVAGLHALAPLVHLAVAAATAAVVWLASRRLTELVEEMHRAEGILAVRGRPHTAPDTRWTRARSWTPVQRWGVQLWARPPPVHAA